MIIENTKYIAVLKMEISFLRRSLKIRRTIFVHKVVIVQSIDNFSSRMQMLYSSTSKNCTP